MSDVMKTIEVANARVVELQKIKADAEASALAHEEQARADRRMMQAAKKEIEQLSTVLKDSRTIAAADQARAAAEQAKSDAEASKRAAEESLLRVTDKEKKLDELLAKAEAKLADKPSDKGETDKPAE
jgi:hypothetical protein